MFTLDVECEVLGGYFAGCERLAGVQRLGGFVERYGSFAWAVTCSDIMVVLWM